MVFSLPSHLRSVLIVGASLAFVFQARTVCGQNASDFDPEQVERLLRSNDILSLRQAVKHVKSHPQSSLIFLPLLAERASHPELTDVFRWMVKQNRDPAIFENLVANAADRHPRTRALIEAAVEDAKRNEPDKPPVETAPPLRPRPPAPARTITQKAPAIRGDKPLGNAAQQLERLQALSRNPNGSPPETEDWGFLFQVMTQLVPIDRSPAAATRTSEFYPVFRQARSLIEAFYPTGKQVVWDFILDPETENPDRLISVLERFSDKDRETFDFLWQLARGDDPKRRVAALNRIRFARTGADQFVDPLIAEMAARPRSVREYTIPVMRITPVLSDPSRSKLLTWQLGQFESALANVSGDIPVHQQQLDVVDHAASVVRSMSPEAQAGWVDRIVAQASASDQPLVYLRLLVVMRGRIDSASGLLRRLLDESTSKRDRLTVARLLYRADGNRSGVYPLFREVVVQPAPVTDELFIALLGLMEVGADAAELTPDLLRLLDNPAVSMYHGTLLLTIEKIGPAAGDRAAPALLALLSDPSKSQLRHQVVQTLKAIKPPAASVLPSLVSLAVNADNTVNSQTRGDALILIAEYGSQAANFHDQIRRLLESDDPHVSSRAKRCIDQIGRGSLPNQSPTVPLPSPR